MTTHLPEIISCVALLLSVIAFFISTRPSISDVRIIYPMSPINYRFLVLFQYDNLDLYSCVVSAPDPDCARLRAVEYARNADDIPFNLGDILTVIDTNLNVHYQQ